MTINRVVMIVAFLSLTACGGLIGGNNSAFQKVGVGTYSAEAEEFDATEEFAISENEEASGGELLESRGDGDAKTKFEGDEGIYTMLVEMDGDEEGESKIEIHVNDEKVKEFTVGEEKKNNEEESEEKDVKLNEIEKKEIVVVDEIELKDGDEIKIRVKKKTGERVEMDRVTLVDEKEVERERIGERETNRERRMRDFLENQEEGRELSNEEDNEEGDREVSEQPKEDREEETPREIKETGDREVSREI